MCRADQSSLRGRFYRGWVVLWSIDLLILVAGCILVWYYRNPRQASLWTLKVAAVLIYEQLFLLRNRRRILRGPNLAHLWGMANILSLSRGTMIALLAGFLFTAKQTGILAWLPAFLYSLLASLDFLDGYWARKSNTQTNMGELLDQEYDGLGILIAVVLVIQWRHLPVIFLLIGLAKYVFAWGISWRRLRGGSVLPLPPSYLRRRLAGFQMGILAVFLWPIAGPPGTLLAELIIGVPLLVGFVRDWLFVSGALDPEDPIYLRIRRIYYTVACKWLPLLIRAFLGAAAVIAVLTSIRAGAPPPDWLSSSSLPAFLPPAVLLAVIYTVLRLLLLLFLTAGLFTSASALLLLLLEGLVIFLGGLDAWTALIVSSIMLLYLFGPGPYRLELRSSAASSEDPAGQ
jgi:CDP-diacylglycerol--glycerol-3-phosphate 3-phosphatidyltransferase